MSMQSDSRIITEVTTAEVAITITEEIEVELITSTLTLTEEVNKLHNSGATQTGEETRTEEIEEATLKEPALNNICNKPRIIHPTSRAKTLKMCADTAKSQDTQSRTAGLCKPKTRPEG